MVRYFKLSRRDFLIYREKINNLESYHVINDYSREGTIASLFVPLLIILDMKNIEEKRKFLNGESRYLEITKMTTEGRNLYENFYNPYKELEQEERMENGYERFKVAYNFLFGNAEKEEVSEARLEIDRSLKEKILECCSQMSINS